MPSQKKAYSSKGKKWRKENIEAGETLSFYTNEGVRQTLKNKVLNLNLYNGVVNAEDIANVLNPDNIDASFVPDNVPHIPIVVPKVKLLVGEELRRRFDFQVIATNPDAISQKEESLNQFLYQKLVALLSEQYSDKELEQKLKELERERKYSWSDRRENMGNMILKHYYKELEMKRKFSEGFEHALVMAEEMYQTEISNSEPTFELLNPLKVYTYRNSMSEKIEDSDMIVIEDHWSPGKIIDKWHEDLKPADIEEISKLGVHAQTDGSGSYTDDDSHHLYIRAQLENPIDGYLGFGSALGHTYSKNYVDPYGNVRVFRVYWKSYRKMLKIKYYDEVGDVQYDLRTEEYIVDTDRGEEIDKTLWVPEWWEGTKIGKDIYINMRPMQVQFTTVNNPSSAHPGIIGQVYNTNQGRGVSMIDRVKNLQYMYDAVSDRLNKSIGANHGKILEVDISKIPSNWEVDQWLHYAYVNKVAIVDGFKEGRQGASTGKLVSAQNGMGGKVLDMETGNHIQGNIELLRYIKEEIGELTGVSEQRQGQIDNRETARGIERSVTQSSHITEYWFAKHEDVKIRALNAFLEVAKVALKGRNKKVQYILDDASIAILHIDGDEFAEADYGVLVSNTNTAIEFEQTIKRYGELYIQRGGKLSNIMDLYFSHSLSDMRNRLEIAEEKEQEEQNAAQREQVEAQKQQAEQAAALEQQKLQLDKYKVDEDNATKLAIAAMGNQGETPEVETSEENPLDREKFEFDKEMGRRKAGQEDKKITEAVKQHEDKMKLEAKKLKKASATTSSAKK